MLSCSLLLAGTACSGVTAQNKDDYERVTQAIDAIELPPGSSDETREGQSGAEGTYGRSLEYKRRAILPMDLSLGEALRFVLESAESQGWDVLDVRCDNYSTLLGSPTEDYVVNINARESDEGVVVTFNTTGGPTPMYSPADLRGNSDWDCLDD